MSQSIQRILERAGIEINGSCPWDLQVHDERLWRRVLLGGNVGLGDAYMDGWWDCQAIDELDTLHPGIEARLIRDAQLRPDFSVVVDGTVSYRKLRQPLSEDSEVHLIPAISGG